MNDSIRWIGISVLIVFLIVSSTAFLSNGVAPTGLISLNAILSQVTGGIVGLPDCRVSLDIEVPESFTLYPTTPTDMTVKVSNVKCGVTHAELELVNFPEEYYTVMPKYHASLAPGRTYKYLVHFNAPEEQSGMIYLAKVRIKATSLLFYSDEFEVRVASMPEKPAATAGAEPIEKVITTESEGVIESVLSGQSWWGIGLVLVITAISLVIYEYVPHEEKRKKK